MGCNSSKSAGVESAYNDKNKNKSNNHGTSMSKNRNSGASLNSKNATPVTTNSSLKNNSSGGVKPSRSASASLSQAPSMDESVSAIVNSAISPNKPERLYKLLVKALQAPTIQQRNTLYQKVLEHCQQEPMAAKWENPTTKSTALHLACRLIDTDTSLSTFAAAEGGPCLLLQVLDTLLAIHREALRHPDAAGHIPLHYAVAPTTHFSHGKNIGDDEHPQHQLPQYEWKLRSIFLHHLLDADTLGAKHYLHRNDVVFESGDSTGACSPLYRVLQTLPDDFDPNCPTAEYVHVLCSYSHTLMGNKSDGDLPLALLYRRFTRQFDISEKFFAGDNSRPEVVQHRKDYKQAAGTTWKIMEILLRPPHDGGDHASANWGIVHRAVQVETPPDLLRYIVETNAQDLTRLDSAGNLPLHYAAAATNPTSQQQQSDPAFPSFYSKYVVDELLYKFPEAASMQDAQGRYPLTIAIQSGKQWIGGGIKSLLDAYPDALNQVKLDEHPALQRALSMTAEDEKETKDDDDDDDDDEYEQDGKAGIIKDNPHDAIMLVQNPNADVFEIVSSMWAHEEDAGVQMLGCCAISRLVEKNADDVQAILRIALSAVAAVVNAMKAHPNEMIVQEKACHALTCLAPAADGKREVSMVASGAVSAIVGAMQAHVGDAKVQEHACAAIAAIVCQADRATVVASVSGVTAILNAIAAHAQVENVQVEGLQALVKLTDFAAEANLPELPKTQTEPLLVAAKEQFAENDRIQQLAEVLMTRMSV